MKIAYIGTYPPRACGIGTFTQNLIRAVFASDKETSLTRHAQVVALTDNLENYDFPKEVSFCISDQNQQSYRAAAACLNDSEAQVVVLQHEYGIFGGQDGAFVLSLVEDLQKPLVATFHTILKEPSAGQKFVLQKIAAKAGRVVVMTRLAKQFLEEIYEIPAAKIAVIEHGVPDVETASREDLRGKLGFEGKKVLFTFGLLGRGKGIETVINALPAIVEKHPNLRYVVLGKTHPAVLRGSGEEYREHLVELASQRGVAENVQFINSFADEKLLWEHLKACDLYVTPYLNEAQITSGTLSYAIGAGAAVVSTPYWHATELLADGRGRLFDFRNSEQLAGVASELLDNPEQLAELRGRAQAYGGKLKWTLVGKQYHNLFRHVAADRKNSLDGGSALTAEMPPLSFKHLRTLTDDTGILQHAKFATPNRAEGYCLDDNARALIVALAGHRLHPDKWLERAASTYLGYLLHCQREDGLFRNFMSYERQFLEDKGSEDSFGRALWALGYAVAHPLNRSFFSMALEIFNRAKPHLKTMRSIRSLSYGMMGLYHYLKKFPGDENTLQLLHNLRQRFCEHYRDTRDGDWHWFENSLTYCNAILPLALLQSLELMPDDEVEQVALESTRFLEKLTHGKGWCSPIGCEQFYEKGGERSQFDQQPVDVMTKVLLNLQAHRTTGRKRFFKKALTCLEWFHGKNDLHLPLADPETGGCCDGLNASGTNQNQGAESTISYLLARLAVEEAIRGQLAAAEVPGGTVSSSGDGMPAFASRGNGAEKHLKVSAAIQNERQL